MKREKPRKRDENFQTELNNLGLNVRYYRERKNLTQKELGALVDLKRNSIYRIEKGRLSPNLQSLSMIASKLDRRLVDFFMPAASHETNSTVNEKSVAVETLALPCHQPQRP